MDLLWKRRYYFSNIAGGLKIYIDGPRSSKSDLSSHIFDHTLGQIIAIYPGKYNVHLHQQSFIV